MDLAEIITDELRRLDQLNFALAKKQLDDGYSDNIRVAIFRLDEYRNSLKAINCGGIAYKSTLMDKTIAKALEGEK